MKLTYPAQKKEFCVGITKENELVFVNIEIGSCDNDSYTIGHDTYEGIITETKGEEEARERLEDPDYWDGLDMLDQKCFLTDFINWQEVADHVISTDGWQNTNGEYQYIGEYEDVSYYINFSGCGCLLEDNDLKKKYKKLLLSKEDVKILVESDKLHLKDFKRYTKAEKEFFKTKVLPLFEKKNQSLEDVGYLIPNLLKEVKE